MSSTPQPPAPAKHTPKIIVWAVLATLVFTGVVGFFVARAAVPAEIPAGAGEVVRENSRVLSRAPEEKAVLVEFLDFECESCRAAYPFVEELRAEYADTVTFVHRYFPLPGHRNSMNAAIAVEAAAEQGAYEKMYQRMFQTQAQWGESA